MEPKYPSVHVDLAGEDGNAYSILARTRKALLRGGVHPTEAQVFLDEATSGDYDHLLATVCKWVVTDGGRP